MVVAAQQWFRGLKNVTSDVMLALVDAESGQQGFVIIGTDEFLQLHDSAFARLAAPLDS